MQQLLATLHDGLDALFMGLDGSDGSQQARYIHPPRPPWAPQHLEHLDTRYVRLLLDTPSMIKKWRLGTYTGPAFGQQGVSLVQDVLPPHPSPFPSPLPSHGVGLCFRPHLPSGEAWPISTPPAPFVACSSCCPSSIQCQMLISCLATGPQHRARQRAARPCSAALALYSFG